MDGLGQAVGNGISSLVGGAIGAIGGAISGIVNALGSVLPPGAVPVVGVGVLLLVLFLLFKR